MRGISFKQAVFAILKPELSASCCRVLAGSCMAFLSLGLIYYLNTRHLAQYITYPKTAHPAETAYARQEIKTEGDQYLFKYVFKNHKEELVTWEWQFKKSFMDELSNQFGIPENIYHMNPGTPQEVTRKKLAIREGLFVEMEGKIEPNYKAVTDIHNIVTAPLYELAKQTANDMGGNRSDQVELLLKFCQDMPIKDIPDKYKGRVIQGLFPPSLSLVSGYGDCDSKAMIFASTLSNDELIKMVVIYLPNHVLIGVRANARPNQASIKFKGEDYIVCQPSGPDRFNVGMRSDKLGPIQMVRAL
jgi:hypothetical protein